MTHRTDNGLFDGSGYTLPDKDPDMVNGEEFFAENASNAKIQVSGIAASAAQNCETVRRGLPSCDYGFIGETVEIGQARYVIGGASA